MTVQKYFLALLMTAALSAAAPALTQRANVERGNPAPIAASAATVVPALVPYSGIAMGGDGKPLAGETGVTFLIYKEEQDGESLWTETQTVAFDSSGRYKVQLGASSSNGLPSDLFVTGEARWLEVEVAGQNPQPRLLLANVPYALKAADASTLADFRPPPTRSPDQTQKQRPLQA